MKRSAPDSDSNAAPPAKKIVRVYKRTKPVDPPINALQYKGPVVPKKTSNNSESCTVELVQQTTLNGAVGGVITQVYGADPSGSPDWTNLTNLWKEFRVLGMRVAYYPANRYNRGSVYTYPLATVIDRQANNSMPLSSWTQAANYGSFQMKSLDDPWYREIKAIDMEEMSFQHTSGFQPQFYLKLFADNITAGTNYGLVLLTFRVQMKNRM